MLEAPRESVDQLGRALHLVESAVFAPPGDVGNRLTAGVQTGTGRRDVRNRFHDHFGLLS